jgi:hypothetical protein
VLYFIKWCDNITEGGLPKSSLRNFDEKISYIFQKFIESPRSAVNDSQIYSVPFHPFMSGMQVSLFFVSTKLRYLVLLRLLLFQKPDLRPTNYYQKRHSLPAHTHTHTRCSTEMRNNVDDDNVI